MKVRRVGIVLGCIVLEVGSVIGIASICKGGREEANHEICHFVRGSKSVCPVAARKSGENECPFVSGTALRCPRGCAASSRCSRDDGGAGRVVGPRAEFDVPAGKGACPLVADEESSHGSSSGAKTMEFQGVKGTPAASGRPGTSSCAISI